jgi:hypothetical protein
VAEERVHRRRRRRRGRGGGAGSVVPAEREAEARAQAKGAAPPPNWQWRTFPVLFAFVLGIVIMGLAVADPVMSAVLFFAALFGVAFGLAHIVTRAIVARRRR